jgi:hypothetical protein
MFSPTSQEEFTQVAWAQMMQFNKEAMMFALSKGKLGNKPAYIDFDDQNPQNPLLDTELTSIHKYFNENITHNQTYHFSNPYVT